jgi:hypothetical protein
VAHPGFDLRNVKESFAFFETSIPETGAHPAHLLLAIISPGLYQSMKCAMQAKYQVSYSINYLLINYYYLLINYLVCSLLGWLFGWMVGWLVR